MNTWQKQTEVFFSKKKKAVVNKKNLQTVFIARVTSMNLQINRQINNKETNHFESQQEQWINPIERIGSRMFNTKHKISGFNHFKDVKDDT